MVGLISKCCIGAALLFLTGACGAESVRNPETVLPKEKLSCELPTTPEAPKGKTDVYDAMARAAKYNVGVMVEKMYAKIYSLNSSVPPTEIIDNLLSSSTGQDNKVYNGIRALDYAIAYASAGVSSQPQAVHDDILEKSAQNLALAAIKSHNDMLFVERKDRDVLKMISDVRKQLSELERRQDSNGFLREEEAELKKALEVSLYKLNGFHDLFLARQIEYRSLIKDKREKPELDGRKFYELDKFDSRLTAAVFEQSALRYRHEFKEMKKLKDYSYNSVFRYMTLSFDNSHRLDVNGYEQNNPLFVDSLQKQAETMAHKLADAVGAYQNAKSEDQRFRQKEVVYDDLAAAIFTQIELAYNMLKMIELDLENVDKQIKSLKKETALLKNRSLNYSQKMELLEKQTNLVSLEMTRSQIVGERAVAIRALFFYAGYAPFNCPTLMLPPASIARILKEGFQRDVVKMLAEMPIRPEAVPENINEWARGDNWLENLMSEKEDDLPRTDDEAPKPQSEYDLYTGEEYNSKQVMQLGAYQNVRNAKADWNVLTEVYPQLRRYKPVIIRTESRGRMLNHLVIQSKNGGFRDLCNELRRDKVPCILK